MKGVSRPRPTNLPGVTRLRLAADLEERIRAYAAKEQITKSEAVRRLIEAGLAALKGQQG